MVTNYNRNQYNGLRENINNLFGHMKKGSINYVLELLKTLKELYFSNYIQFEDCMNLLNDRDYELMIPQQNTDNIHGYNNERLNIFISFAELATIVFRFTNTQKNLKTNKLIRKMIYLYDSFYSLENPHLKSACYLAFDNFGNYNDNWKNPFILLQYLHLVTNKDVLSHLGSVYISCFDTLACTKENFQMIDFNFPYRNLINICKNCVDNSLVHQYYEILKQMIILLGDYYEESLTILKPEVKRDLFLLISKSKNEMMEGNNINIVNNNLNSNNNIIS